MKVKSKVMAALGSIKDHAAIGRASINAGRNNILSSIEIALLRSTNSSEDAPPNDKYIREILFVISNAPGLITFLARRISTRLESTRDPLVALKTLLLLHRLLRGGDRYFEQDLRNLWSSGDLRISRLRWISSSDHPADHPFFAFILKYSLFLEERMEWLINQAGKLEPIIRPLLPGSSVGLLSYEEKAIESVLYRLSKSQTLVDRIMDCCLPAVSNSRSRSSSHATMQSAMNVVLKESFRIYESFCEDAEIVFTSFSSLKKHTRVLALDILRKTCLQTPNLYDFYETCKKRVVVGIKNLEYPSVRIITAKQVSSMDQFQPKESTTIVRSTKEEEMNKRRESTGAQICVSSTKPFPQGLETKISTVWVEFDDDEEEDSQSSSFSFEGESSKKIWKALELL